MLKEFKNFIESCSSLNLAFGEELALALSSSGTAVRKAVLSFGLPSALGTNSPVFAALSPIVKLQPSPADDRLGKLYKRVRIRCDVPWEVARQSKDQFRREGAKGARHFYLYR